MQKLIHENKIILIGITGYARTGKDTFAKIIQNEVKLPSKILSFASDLKVLSRDFVMKILGIDTFTNNDEEKKIIRPLLVGFGESCRNKDPYFWVKRVAEKADKFAETSESELNYIIIPDCRFSNESAWIKSHDKSLLINISREGVTAPNEHEMINIPEICAKFADFSVNWFNIEKSGFQEEKYLTNPRLIGIVKETLENLNWNHQQLLRT